MLTRALLALTLPVFGASCNSSNPSHSALVDAPENSRTTDTQAPGWNILMQGPGIPDGQSSSYTIAKDTAVTHDGHPSEAIQSTSSVDNAWRCLTQGIRADQYRGKRVRLSGYIKTQDVNEFAGVWMRVDGISRQQEFGRSGKDKSGTTDWTQYSTVLDVDKDAAIIFFGAVLVGAGRVWVADVKFEVVDPKQVPATGSWLGPDYSHDKEKPQNLDFSVKSTKNPLEVVGWLTPTEKWGDSAHLDTATVRNGKPTVALTAEGAQKPSAFQEILAAPYRGKRVRFQAYIKMSDKAQGDVMLAVPGGGQWDQAAVPQYVEKNNEWVKNTAEWKLVAAVIDIPEWANCIQFGADLTTPGKMWMSEASFAIVDPNKVQADYTPAPRAIYTQSDLRSYSFKPANLDFTK